MTTFPPYVKISADAHIAKHAKNGYPSQIEERI